MNTYSIYISGNVLIEATDYESAVANLFDSLGEVLTEWDIEAAYDNDGVNVY